MTRLLPALALLLPSVVLAAADPHAGHAPTPAQWRLLGFSAVNFGIFVFLMYRFAHVPIRDFLSGRRRLVVESMAEAARLKADAERVKREYEAKAAALDRAREDLVAEVRSIAEADRQRALAAAAQAAERMRQEAERTAQSDLERAREELRAEAARLAQELAREEIQRRMTEQDKRRLITDFIARVSR